MLIPRISAQGSERAGPAHPGTRLPIVRALIWWPNVRERQAEESGERGSKRLIESAQLGEAGERARVVAHRDSGCLQGTQQLAQSRLRQPLGRGRTWLPSHDQRQVDQR